MATLAKMVTKTLDVGVSNTTIDLSATIKSFDVLDTKFIFGITSNQGLAINLSGATVKYIVEYYVEGKTYAIEGNCLVVDINTISFNLPDQLRGYNGKALIGIYATLTDGTKIDIKNIVVNIEPSLMDKGTDFKARYYFESFDNVLASVKEAGNKAISQINTVLPGVQSKVAEIDRQIKSLPPIPDLYVAYANSADGTVDFTKTKPKENLLVLKNKIVGKYVTNDGKLVNSTNYTTSDYINVAASKTYQIYYENNISISGKSGQHWLGYVFYDNNKNYIDKSYATLYWDDVYSGLTRTNKTVNVPTNATYIRISWVSTYDYKIKFEKSDVQTMYLPSPMDDYLKAYMKYIGYGIKDSTNSADYRWQVNSEWQKAQLDGLSVGGENLFLDAAFRNGKLLKPMIDNYVSGHWIMYNVHQSYEIDKYNEQISYVQFTSLSTMNLGITQFLDKDVMQAGKEYCIRVLTMCETADYNIVININKKSSDGKIDWYYYNIFDKTIKATSTYHEISVKFRVPDNYDGEIYGVSIFNSGTTNSEGHIIKIVKPKLEKGDLFTDFSVATLDDNVLGSHPINSVLTTLSSENPSSTLGGTWTQLGTESKFGSTIYYWKRTN